MLNVLNNLLCLKPEASSGSSQRCKRSVGLPCRQTPVQTVNSNFYLFLAGPSWSFTNKEALYSSVHCSNKHFDTRQQSNRNLQKKWKSTTSSLAPPWDLERSLAGGCWRAGGGWCWPTRTWPRARRRPGSSGRGSGSESASSWSLMSLKGERKRINRWSLSMNYWYSRDLRLLSNLHGLFSIAYFWVQTKIPHSPRRHDNSVTISYFVREAFIKKQDLRSRVSIITTFL